MASVAISLTMAFLMVPGHFPGVLMNPGALLYGLIAGMIAMVPNMFPIILVFGIMGTFTSGRHRHHDDGVGCSRHCSG